MSTTCKRLITAAAVIVWVCAFAWLTGFDFGSRGAEATLYFLGFSITAAFAYTFLFNDESLARSLKNCGLLTGHATGFPGDTKPVAEPSNV